jgi:hypothetical protein
VKHEEISELLGAYALDAVDDAERDVVEAHLAECARCQAEVAEHRDVAALLAHRSAPAPDGVWDRIAGSLEASPPPLQLESHRARRWPRLGLALAAAAAVVVAVLGVQVVRQNDRIDDLQAALHDPVSASYVAALGDPESEVVDLRTEDGRVVGHVAVTRDGTAYLGADALATLPDDRTYQVWGRAGDALVSLGLLGNRPAVVSFPARSYTLYAITAEVAGGVVQTRNTPVASATVTT